ncbi:CZB domain-containing protein [Caulobacter hibisci]|uniref:CZB domain-containing protein n=1 Tax=Caulobacter hibisci TaxID=2035993 RepID=A0ABS0SSA6_9CAUL|nr:CZB domain-containing protein [Caulobacter hibisci]MBI1682406.1 CZB domain-containing protein [Caulobacter hibisci]
MDFQEQTHFHNRICEELDTALAAGATVDAAAVRAERQCAAGQWLHGEGHRRMPGSHLHLHCLEAHRDFHRAAGQVADMINRGATADARKSLRNGGTLALAKTELASALRKMRIATEATAG